MIKITFLITLYKDNENLFIFRYKIVVFCY